MLRSYPTTDRRVGSLVAETRLHRKPLGIPSRRLANDKVIGDFTAFGDISFLWFIDFTFSNIFSNAFPGIFLVNDASTDMY